MNQRLTYQEMCREAATAQGLDPITDRLAGEGIRHSIEQTGGFVMLVRIPLAEPAWIGVTASDDQPGAWCVVDYQDDADEGSAIAGAGSYACSAEDAVAAIHERVAMAGHETARAQRRLVNAYVVYSVPDGLGGTYTLLGEGAWGRPEDALDYAQSRREAYHDRHGATPLTEAPWHREGGYGGPPGSYRPPSAAVGVEIHDVRTGERWFVPTTGSRLGPIGPRAEASERVRWHAGPEGLLEVEADRPTSGAGPRHPNRPVRPGVDNLRPRPDALERADPPDISL
jgi:hypothetical protein